MIRIYRRLIITCFTLLSISNAGLSQQLSKEKVEVSFNHMVLYVDSTTYYDIKNNDFLKDEFASFEYRTTTRDDHYYTGIYYYGTNTYLEFFNSDADTVYVDGDCGIGLSTDDTNGLLVLNNLLSDTYSLYMDTISRQYDSLLIPWFSCISFDNLFIENDVALWIWIMEYMPDFLQKWHSPNIDSNYVISRKTVLDRYKSVLDAKVINPIMHDISGITIAADSTETDELKKLFKIIGYNIELNDTRTLLYNETFSITIIPETEKVRGLTEIRFKTNRSPVKDNQISFGNKSVLHFKDDSLANWSFQF